MVAAGPLPAEEPRGARDWLLHVIWRQKWVILSMLALSGIAALAYMRVATPQYASTAKLYVQPAGPLLGNGQPGLTQANNNFLYTQRELITSDPVLRIASARKEVQATGPIKGRDKPEQALAKILVCDLDRSSDIISLTAYAPDPHDAQIIANAMLDAYMTYQTKPKISTTGDTLQLLESKKKETEAELAGKLTQLDAMETKYGPLGEKDEHTNLVMSQLKGLSDALVAAQKEAIDARSAYEEARRAMGLRADKGLAPPSSGVDSDILIADANSLALLRTSMLQAQAQLQELQQRYLPNHPSVVFWKQRLASLNRDYLLSIQLRYIAAQRLEADFQKSFNQQRDRANEISAHAREYGRLQEEIDRLKKERDNLNASLKSIQLQQEAGGVVIEIVQPALTQAKPAIPSARRAFPIALAVGLVAGLMLAVMREWVDDRFRSAGEIKSSLGIPLLAVIPQSATKRSPSVSGQRILLDPASDAAEAYRALRTAVGFAAPAGEMKTLLITSPSSGDGKTTLVSNLAIAMAQAGKRTIVLDCDLRRPMQHEIFGVKNNTGLSMLLAGRASLDTAIQRTSVAGLEILPCGPAPANPAEILNSREFGEALEDLADKYDCVVIDSPPVDAANDARIIAASADATLVVLKAPTAHRRQAEKARDALLGVGARIIGLVVNDAPRRTQTPYGGQTNPTRKYVPGLTSQEHDVLQARTK